MLERQQAMEAARQRQRAETDDRSLARTQLQIDAADRRSERQIQAAEERQARQLEARGDGGGLTATQHRSNLEIDAAREAVAGMTPEEVRRRTAPTTTATGRENPDYDPALSRWAKLAARRKVGQDDEFDALQRGQVPASHQADGPSPARRELVGRFQSDRTMNRNRLGKETANGVEVLDPNGKLLGYYR